MSRCSDRIAEAIRRVASETVRRHLRDPRIHRFVTITRVELTPDLRYAKINYTIFGEEKETKRVAKGLKSAKGFIRKCIGDELELRYAPDISFRLDEKAEYAKRIEDVLTKIKKEASDETDKKNNKSD